MFKNYIYVWENIMNFEDRADRVEFWSFWFANVMIGIVLQLVGGDVVSGIFGVVIFLPTLAVSVNDCMILTSREHGCFLRLQGLVHWFYLYFMLRQVIMDVIGMEGNL